MVKVVLNMNIYPKLEKGNLTYVFMHPDAKRCCW